MNVFKSLAVALALALLQQSAHAALVANNLAGNTEYDGWVNLTQSNIGNPPLTFPPAGIGSNEAGSGDAMLTRPTGGHYPSGSSLYSFSTNSTFQIADTSLLSDVNTVVFSILTWPNPDFGDGSTPAGSINAGPTLNFNGGSQALAADYTGAVQSGTIDFGGPLDTYIYTFQWDLSSEASTVASYDVDWGQIVHAGIIALQLESADVFSRSAATVPEPACGLLAMLGLAGFAGTRRRTRTP